MTITATAVTGGRERRDFFHLPSAIYRRDPVWIAPIGSEVRRTLDPNRNPYFKHASLRLFLARRDGVPAARLALVIDDRHTPECGLRTAFFGFFESLNDPEAVSTLFREAEGVALANGALRLEGPFNPHHYAELGLQLDRFDAPPAFFQPHNPPYYAELLEGTGFRISKRLQTMRNDDIRGYLERRYGFPDRGETASRDGFTVRAFSRRRRAADLERIREVNNDAFASNWRFLPLSREEYAFSAKHMSLVSKPGHILIAESEGRPAAVLHCALDINPILREWRGKAGLLKYARFLRARRDIKTIILFTVAIKRQYRHTRVYFVLLEAFARLASGYAAAETSWLSADNIPAVRAAESLGMRPDRQFAVFAKEIRP